MMKLQELLEKATERPWKIAPCACGSPVCTKFVLTKPFNVDGRLTRSDALLQRHAVDHLEPFLIVLSGVAASLRSIIECETLAMGPFAKSIITTQIKIAEEAIREVEEVTP